MKKMINLKMKQKIMKLKKIKIIINEILAYFLEHFILNQKILFNIYNN